MAFADEPETLVVAQQTLDDLLAPATEAEIVIPAGLTSQEIIDLLNADDRLTGEIDRVPGEGRLLPGVYPLDPGETRPQFVVELERSNNQRVSEIWLGRDRDLPVDSPVELLILASLVEGEGAADSDLGRIAAVFVNRLRLGMNLQSDASVLYGVFGGAAPEGYALSRSDLEATTPYNTYQFAGLPAGPIGNPGPAALKAAANPAPTADLYFVRHIDSSYLFAETFEEHVANVALVREAAAAARAANQ